MKRNKLQRRVWRETKALRRIKEDRAEHLHDHRCICFGGPWREYRKFVSRMADNPQMCSACCGNMRKDYGPSIGERRQFLRECDQY